MFEIQRLRMFYKTTLCAVISYKLRCLLRFRDMVLSLPVYTLRFFLSFFFFFFCYQFDRNPKPNQFKQQKGLVGLHKWKDIELNASFFFLLIMVLCTSPWFFLFYLLKNDSFVLQVDFSSWQNCSNIYTCIFYHLGHRRLSMYWNPH